MIRKLPTENCIAMYVLMLLDFSFKDIKYVVVHRSFDDRFFDKIKKYTYKKSMECYYQTFKENNKFNILYKKLIENEIKLTNSHHRILCKWLNVGISVLKKNIKDVTNIIKQQDNYVSNYYSNDKNYFFFIANTETNIGMILFTNSILKRNYLKFLKSKLLKLNLEIVYLSRKHDHIEGLLFLMNFIPTYYKKKNISNNLLRWEKNEV